ncbi:30S ribosomal protein S9 [Tundrisphaera sp. TA3]|uniref:30S ribosomal protein S9 n=1 Tax=Tundrisphaera sp. TA3 TaxID=3435775 RepID=UPI003EBD208E
MATAVNNPYIWGTGRRKTAVARVRIQEGTGKFVVNKLDVDAYFVEETHRSDVRSPLQATEMGGRLDVFVNVAGSGKSAQSGAVLLGIARALAEFRPDLLPALRDGDFLTRDARMVERKKYGHKKARRSFQFSKR